VAAAGSGVPVKVAENLKLFGNRGARIRAVAARHGRRRMTAWALRRDPRGGGIVPIRDSECRMRDSVTDDSPSATGRGLVPVTRPGSAGGDPARPHYARPSAVFLAQLVAVAQGAPQTRARRQTTAGHAAALYAAAARLDQRCEVERSM
jgi:hypothetical protein